MANTVVVSTADASMDDLPLFMQAASGDAAISYSAQAWRTELDALFAAEGALNPDGGAFKVSQRAAGANFSVDVASGRAVITGDNIANQGKYIVRSVGVVNVVTPTAPASGTRVHRIIARVRDKQAVGSGTYDWTIELLEDTGTGTPVEPPSAITLALVSIAAGQASVQNSHITDQRTPAFTAASPVQFRRKTADQAVVSSVTLVDDDTLFVPVAANAIYVVQGFIAYNAGGVGDLRIGWSGPSGATLDWNVGGGPSDQTTQAMTVWMGVNNIGGFDTVGGLGGANISNARPLGILVVGSTPGLFRFRFAQGAFDGFGTTIKTGSALWATRVA